MSRAASTSSVPPEHRRTRQAATTRPDFPRGDVKIRPEGQRVQVVDVQPQPPARRLRGAGAEPTVQVDPPPTVPVLVTEIESPLVPWPANVPVPPAVQPLGTIGVGEHYAPTIAERCVMDLCGTQSKDLPRVQAAIDEAVGLVRAEYDSTSRLNKELFAGSVPVPSRTKLPPLDLSNMTPKEKVAARKQRAKEEKDLKAQVKKDKAAQAEATAAAKKSAAEAAKAAKKAAAAAKKGTARKK
jgi:hypothetical protein